MTAALDLTSNTGERVGKKREGGGGKRLHLCCDSLLKEPGKCSVISLSFPLFSPLPPFYLSISPSLCVSPAHQNPALIRISAKPRVLDGI